MPNSELANSYALTEQQSQRLWLGLGLVFAVLALFVWTNETALGLLEQQYTDHLRHVRYAWQFLFSGYWIYDVPMRDLEPIGDPRAYIWTNVPYLYPPGAVLLFLPFALLEFPLGVSSSVLSRLLLTEFACANLVGVGLLLRSVRKDDGMAAWFWAACFFLLSMYWSLNGQYDAIPLMLLATGGFFSKQRGRSMWCLAGAMFLKYQSLLYLPALVRVLLADLREGGWPRVRKNRAWLSVFGLLAASAVALWMARSGLSPARENPMNWRLLGVDTRATAGLLVVAGFTLGSVVMREHFLAVCIAWCGLGFAAISQLQAWYVAYLFPYWAYFDGARRRNYFIAFVFTLLYVMRWLPDPYGLWSGIKNAP